ncbi:hypothetical protein ASPZODRAFT_14126 [Penicilliopsis zonata CBS 506.65]|uniref:Uncharacterized protein n=1 Tax=Penicilliopsis zonata CBS 506.65 TaxID=1073090 RepID=A0A1L9SQR1_9EURO|nr:hypothetical protein ASPZODRAFT_14126 [Penicilliopsis zonata CBS 506.65]OJJ49411.1 hypothetical protein ASPZODRAFT_14126 [Penicilliopsis zonata CBS 506.65]
MSSTKPSMDSSPDAWEDNWESQADKLDAQPTSLPEKKVSSKVTKAQRRAQQAEFNRQLWADAESPQTFHYLETRSSVPLKQDIKQTVTVLSRRPQLVTREPGSSASVDASVDGIRALGINGADYESDDEGNGKRQEMTPQERHAKALRDREEKQRRYEEARERLFGSPSANGSGTSSPGSTTPPRQYSNGGGGGEGRGKGRHRGGGGGSGRDNREKRDSSATSGRSSRQLYDPGYSVKPSQKRDRQQKGDRQDDEQQQAVQQPLRSPRGPDGSGRGGFGFANRGARAT